MKTKKAMSAVIAVMLLIFIVVTGTAIIWKILIKTVDEGLNESKSCYDLLGKIEVNSEYTCYDSVNDEMYVSVSVGDIETESLFIVISGEDSGVSFELTNDLKTIPNLWNYTRSNQVKAPGANAGQTYIASSITEEPVSIEIASKLNGNLCEGEKFTAIESCYDLSPLEGCQPPCETGYSCVGTSCVATCEDSDGGQIEDVAGTVTMGTNTYDDLCEDGNWVQEWYCDAGGQPNEISIICPSGCESGACVVEPTIFFEDGFEDSGDWFVNWGGNGATDWRRGGIPHSGLWSVYSRDTLEGALTSRSIDVSSANTITVEFYYRLTATETDDFRLYYFNGASYVPIASLGVGVGPSVGGWFYYEDIITDSQYLRSNFRIRFYSTLADGGVWGTDEYVRVDDVKITGIIG